MEYAEMLREAMGTMTQGELSRISGVTQATISRLLSGERKPSYDSRMRLERALPRLRELLLVKVVTG